MKQNGIMMNLMNIMRLQMFCAIIFPLYISAQDNQYSNHWIDFSQKYLKIEIKEKGLYHINFSQISDNGIAISATEKDYIQVFNKGKEIPILIKDNNQVVFYGEPNDGASDSLLYRPNNQRGNPYYGMYSDIGVYYLTVGKSLGKRIPLINQDIDNSLVFTTWHLEQSLSFFHNDYTNNNSTSNIPDLSQSYFQNNEGWSSKMYKDLESVTYNITLDRYIKGISNPRIKMMVYGNSLNNNYQVGVKTGENLRDTEKFTFNRLQALTKTIELQESDISNNSSSKLQLQSLTKTEIYTTTGRFSIAYYLVEYPQSLIMNGNKSKMIYFPKENQTKWKKIQIADAEETTALFDITDTYNIKQYHTLTSPDKKGIISMIANNTAQNVSLIAVSETRAAQITAATTFTNYSPSQYNYLIITNEKLKPSALQYAAYRSSDSGGSFKTLVVEIKDLYQQFNYGEPSPLAIKNFVNYIISDKNRDKYLLLIGPSSTRYDKIERELPDDVPAIGYPGSDMLLVTGLQGDHEDLPAIPVGRISATLPEQVSGYLNKVKSTEANELNIGWQKNTLHLSGGKTVSELQSLSNSLKGLEPLITDGNQGGSITSMVKQTLAPTENVDISNQVNKGVGLISYYGHGSATTLDFDIGYASSPNNTINNKGKYPLMYFNGCGVGNIFSGRFSTDLSSATKIPLSTDWIFAQEKGAIAVIANTWYSYLSTSNLYLKTLYQYLFNNSPILSIGKIQLETAKAIINESGYNLYSIANLHQSLLQGDPALKLIQVEKPDFTFPEFKNIIIKADNNKPSIGDSDNIQIEIAIENIGKYLKNTPVKIDILLNKSNNAEEKIPVTIDQLSYQDTIRLSIQNNNDIQSITAIINPGYEIPELNEANNITFLNVDWEVASSLKEYSSENFKDEISPIIEVLFDGKKVKNGESVSTEVKLTVQLTDNMPLSTDIRAFKIFIRDCLEETCGYNSISLDDNISINFDNTNSHTITINFTLNEYHLLTSGQKEILITATDQSGNISQPYKITFEVMENIPFTEVIISPNPGIDYVKFQTKTNSTSDKHLSMISYKVIDINGAILRQEQIEIHSQNFNEWYWRPNVGGHYFYEVYLSWSDNSTIIKRGKIIILK